MATPQKNDAKDNGHSSTRNVQQNSYGGDYQNTTRNVRTSAMPGSPKYQQPQTRATVADEFSQSYQDRLIQPQSLTTTEKDTTSQKVTRDENVVYTTNQTPASTTYTHKKKQSTSSDNGLTAARLRATTTNIGIASWGLWAWSLFQLPIALLSLIFFGLAGALDAAVAAAEHNPEDGWIMSLGRAVVRGAMSTVESAASLLTNLFGVSLTILDPATWFLATYFIILAFGIIMLFTMYLIYIFRRLNSLSGQASGLKFGVFTLVFVGYALPFLNLFPWFLVWATVVWKYPK